MWPGAGVHCWRLGRLGGPSDASVVSILKDFERVLDSMEELARRLRASKQDSEMDWDVDLFEASINNDLKYATLLLVLGNLNLVKLNVGSRHKLNANSTEIYTPLQGACSQGHASMASLLLSGPLLVLISTVFAYITIPPGLSLSTHQCRNR